MNMLWCMHPSVSLDSSVIPSWAPGKPVLSVGGRTLLDAVSCAAAPSWSWTLPAWMKVQVPALSKKKSAFPGNR